MTTAVGTRARAALAAAAAATALSPAAAIAAVGPPDPAAQPDPVRRVLTEQANAIMGLGYEQYDAFLRTRPATPLDLTSDGCTVPLPALSVPAFRPACRLHDFGYENYGPHSALRLGPTEDVRLWIDRRFRTEMNRICVASYAGPKRTLQRVGCRVNAEVYYRAVRLFGKPYF